MERTYSHLDEVNMIGKLADLKDKHEKDNLMLHTLIELLVEKGVMSHQEFTDKAAQLDRGSTILP